MIRGDGHLASLRVRARRAHARRRPPLPARARRLRGARRARRRSSRRPGVATRRVRVRGGDGSHRAMPTRSGRSRATSVERDPRAHPLAARRRATTGARASSPASSTPRARAAREALRISEHATARSSTGPLACLRHFGFDVVEERRGNENGLQVRAAARRPARAAAVLPPHRPGDHAQAARSQGIALKSDARTRVVSIEPLGEAMRLYDITTGTGDFISNGVVSHNCFARPTHKYLDFDAGRDFEKEIVVKVNVPEVLRVGARASRRGRASTSRWGRTPTRTSGSRGATSSCAGSGRRCATSRTRARSSRSRRCCCATST